MVGGYPVTTPAMQAIVPMGDCTAVLVTPDRLLTSAHCLKPGLEQVTVASRTFHLTQCDAHPGYRSLQAAHDIAVCHLAAPAPVDGIAIDEGAPQMGEPITLAGYGLAGALARAQSGLRAVDTAVVSLDAQSFDVGTATQTACLGDSGGPVLTQRGGKMRVAGILHGPSGAICASPTRVTRLDVAGDWLAGELASTGAANGSHVAGRLAIVFCVLAAAALMGWIAVRRASRTPPAVT